MLPKNPPQPPFSKGGSPSPPLEKGDLGGFYKAGLITGLLVFVLTSGKTQSYEGYHGFGHLNFGHSKLFRISNFEFRI
jgi:hypothetical protein